MVAKRNARGVAGSGATGTILPPDLAIPCWGAPLQSPTPFHQAKDSVARIVDFGENFSPQPAFKIDTSAYRVGRAKTVKSAYWVDAKKSSRSMLDKSETLV